MRHDCPGTGTVAAHRTRAGRTNLLAHVLVSKYADHLPLDRQSEIFARDGIDLDRSTLADWVGAASHLLAPLVDQIRSHVLADEKVHADDTPVPVLAPGMGKTRTARLWTYVREDRPAGQDTPPALWFAYTPDRKGEHPRPPPLFHSLVDLRIQPPKPSLREDRTFTLEYRKPEELRQKARQVDVESREHFPHPHSLDYEGCENREILVISG